MAETMADPEQDGPALPHRFADSSALLRLLLGELGQGIDPTGGPVHVSVVADVECHRALHRAHADGRLTDVEFVIKLGELRSLLQAAAVHELAPEIVDLARGPQVMPSVRSLDAIHIATAQVVARHVGEGLVFWTHDERQALAARAGGLTVRGVLASPGPS